MELIDSFRTVQECLIEWLQEGQDRQEGYLEVVLEGYAVLHDRELDSVLRALSHIAAARGEALSFTDSSEVNQNAFDKLLKEDVNPGWERVIEALEDVSLKVIGEPVPSF